MIDSSGTINQIQKTFQDILQFGPSQADQNCIDFFNSLENNLKDINYRSLLPKAIPYSVYPRIIEFLIYTNDETINKVISEVITSISSGKSEDLQELLKYDILHIISDQVGSFKFVNSLVYHLQTITNFISDSNTEISQKAYQIFSFEFLIKTFQCLKCMFNGQPETLVPYFKNYLKCVYMMIDKHSKSVSVHLTTIALIEMRSMQEVIKRDPETCKLFCYCLISMIDSNLITYIDFVGYEFPTFLNDLSKSGSNQIKSYAFPVIGRLILTNNYPIKCEFLDFLNIILDSNPNPDSNDSNDDLFESVLFVCSCFFENTNTAKEAFNNLSLKLDKLFHFYDNTNLSTREKIINLLCAYLNYVSQLQSDIFDHCGKQIQTITNYMFEFILSHERLDQIIQFLYTLSKFISYVSSVCNVESEYVNKFVHDCTECMESLLECDDKTIKEIAYQQLIFLRK